MRLSEALGDHREIRNRLRRFIMKEPDNHLRLFGVGRDTTCPFGDWICKQQGKPLAESDEFKAMAVMHQSFHSIALSVLKLGVANRKEEAFALLDGPYAMLERQLVEAILNLGELDNK